MNGLRKSGFRREILQPKGNIMERKHKQDTQLLKLGNWKLHFYGAVVPKSS